MHRPENVGVNEMQKILWDFEILTDSLIQPRKPNLVLINKN